MKAHGYWITNNFLALERNFYSRKLSMHDKQKENWKKKKKENCQCITVHRGSIIVLCHLVHRAFGLEAPVKHDEGTIYAQ